jgi:outer membrane protein TolC
MTHAAAHATRCLLALSITTQAMHAQIVRRDTLYLDVLQHAAERADARAAQLPLIAQQSLLRLGSIRGELLPTVNAAGSAQYLSDVASVGALVPGLKIPGAYNDQYDAYLTVRAPLVDPTRRSRVAVENAQMHESEARIRSALFQQRAAVSDAFFGIVLREAQLRSLDATIADLDARLKVAVARVTAGSALRSEQLLLEAERARRQQSHTELVIDRDAARDVLGALIGHALPADAVFAIRATPASVAQAIATVDTLRTRPEFAHFDRTRDVLDARRAATAAQDLPRISAFGRSGYGRPGLNPLGRSFDTYWTAGVQVDWSLWNWGRTRRDTEAQLLQRQIVAGDEQAFRDALRRAAITARSQIEGIQRSLQADDSIVAMREQILRETRLRYDEGEVNAAEYVARLTEHLSAALDRDTRRVRLDEARARYLTTLGLEVR